jgi:hypothetical protein
MPSQMIFQNRAIYQTITFGKYRGIYLPRLMITKPYYIIWLFENSAAICNLHSLKIFIRLFNERPFVNRSCSHCGIRATRLSLYMHDPSLRILWWCGQCDSSSSGGDSGRLKVIHSYKDVVCNAKDWCGAPNQNCSRLIREMFNAKGIDGNLTDKKLRAFFNN